MNEQIFFGKSCNKRCENVFMYEICYQASNDYHAPGSMQNNLIFNIAS